MENSGPAPTSIGVRREPSTDPVKAQGILNAVMRKSKQAARMWPQHWSFYNNIREIQEEEAQKLGFKLDEYRAGLRSVSCQPEKDPCPVSIEPSPTALPPTSSVFASYYGARVYAHYWRDQMFTKMRPNDQNYNFVQFNETDKVVQKYARSLRGVHKKQKLRMIGYRAKCTLERYGRLVKTSRDYPTRPPLPPGQIYDPYKQTLIFLGGGSGDPISYKLPPSRCEVTDDMWACPHELSITPFDFDHLQI